MILTCSGHLFEGLPAKVQVLLDLVSLVVVHGEGRCNAHMQRIQYRLKLWGLFVVVVFFSVPVF